MSSWSPESWRSKVATQQPVYPDASAVDAALAELSTLPPLVTSWEIESLKSQLADAAAGHRFLLQGGDCAESFDECESSIIAAKLKILLQMSLVLVHGTQKRVIRVGRFAGQYAKPRTSDTETRHGRTLPVYRGDIVNRAEFSEEGRRPEPRNMIRAYARSAMTLNFIRALIDGGFADLHHPEYWDLDFVRHSPLAAEYQRMVESIGQSLRFMETLAGVRIGQMSRVDFYTSHEALHLAYEQALTRQVPHRTGWYNLSTHFPWVGMRTATSGGGGAHLEYFQGIANPIAVKIGPEMTPDDLRGLLDVLHPRDEPGRMTLIHRFGAREIARCLPPLIDAVRRTGKSVLWCCDPMHGNTQNAQIGSDAVAQRRVDGPDVQARQVNAAPTTTAPALTAQHSALTVKTRKFEHILAELEQAFEIHASHGTYLGGVHFELTGDNVTECTGGARGLSDADLQRAYRSHVDPRLNYEQSLEMAMLIARRVAAMNSAVN
jgi:3-deoxy-7-phosphoheptulonate synthase